MRLLKKIKKPLKEKSRTLIITKDTNLKTTETVDLTLRSIFNRPEFNFFLKDLLSSLNTTGNNENFLQIHNFSKEYLLQKINCAEHHQKIILVNALERLGQHYLRTIETQFAYDPSAKQNPSAVFYPNPPCGKPMFTEIPYSRRNSFINKKTAIAFSGDKLALEFAKIYQEKGFSCSGALNIDTPLANIDILILGINSEFIANYSLNVLSAQEYILHLQQTANLWRKSNPNLKLILYISPFSSTNIDQSFLNATLRVSMEEFCRKSLNNYYFPVFDTIMYSVEKRLQYRLGEENEEIFMKLCQLFEIMFVE